MILQKEISKRRCVIFFLLLYALLELFVALIFVVDVCAAGYF